MTVESSNSIPWYRFNVWAVLAGAATDYISTIIFTGCYTVIYTFGAMRQLIAQGVSIEEAQVQLTAQIALSPIALALGIIGSFLGGYVAGRIAKFHEIKHALTAAVLIMVISAVFNLIIRSPLENLEVPIWRLILGAVLAFGGEAGGAYLAYLQRIKSKATAVQSPG